MNKPLLSSGVLSGAIRFCVLSLTLLLTVGVASVEAQVSGANMVSISDSKDFPPVAIPSGTVFLDSEQAAINNKTRIQQLQVAMASGTMSETRAGIEIAYLDYYNKGLSQGLTVGSSYAKSAGALTEIMGRYQTAPVSDFGVIRQNLLTQITQ